MERKRRALRAGRGLFVVGLLALVSSLAAAEPGDVSPLPDAEEPRLVTLVVRDTEVREVFEMLSRTEGVSIAMSENVQATVSISLFDVEIGEAIRAVAQAAGYGVDRRDDTWIIVDYDEVGEDTADGVTIVRSYRIDYAEPDKVREVIENHLSRYGVVTAVEDRRMIVVEDQPSFLSRVERILEAVDQPPRQILLEAKVLEVTLDKNDTLGIDWNRVMEIEGTDFTVGVRGFTTGTAPGLFFNVMNENLDGAIEALSDDGRVRALASPQLLTVENQEAEVLVGERLGFRVTTTINQVTTESVEFIDSGVILRFTPSVDRQGRVLLEIHPEVSNGIITDGIPSVTTTEVTTRLVAESGERVFIGGLIRDSASESRRGVPVLSKIPILGLLFSRSEWLNRSTETIVIVRASIRDPFGRDPNDVERYERLQELEPDFDHRRQAMEDDLDMTPWKPQLGRFAKEEARAEQTAAEAPPAAIAPQETEVDGSPVAVTSP